MNSSQSLPFFPLPHQPLLSLVFSMMAGEKQASWARSARLGKPGTPFSLTFPGGRNCGLGRLLSALSCAALGEGQEESEADLHFFNASILGLFAATRCWNLLAMFIDNH